ncbi:uncharacterized protein LOC133876257 [Alnus glutinosa]|uniref:uncharacterized protein LOC133876257 n=1 Tax=Alnus glutinosa TaxID=3517 RepID=UPI002D778542|nr:uncharacterized protein LOC133876257 [Alnus glutinosa]
MAKLFIWRACNELLPTRLNLTRRKVIEMKTCPCCDGEEEDALHALWLCPAAKDVWGSSLSCFQKFSFTGPNFRGLFSYCMERCTKEELELMAVTARRIWLRRNAWVFEQRFDHPNAVFIEATKSLREFKSCNVHGQEKMLPARRNEALNSKQPIWIPPPDGVIKVNWDASLNVAKNWVGLGIIARDRCMGARSITHQATMDPKMAKTMAALEALQFSKEAGFWDVVFEGDAAQVVKESVKSTLFF